MALQSRMAATKRRRAPQSGHSSTSMPSSTSIDGFGSDPSTAARACSSPLSVRPDSASRPWSATDRRMRPLLRWTAPRRVRLLVAASLQNGLAGSISPVIGSSVSLGQLTSAVAVAENVGPEGRWIHYGLTSSDVVDTAMAMLIRDACDLIRPGVVDLMDAVLEKAFKHRHAPMIGRTHGVHAEPMTFGLKMALWHAELQRDLARIHDRSPSDLLRERRMTEARRLLRERPGMTVVEAAAQVGIDF